MASKVHYSPEIKWNAVNMKLAGHSSSEIMKSLGIRNDTQIKIWMRWYRNRCNSTPAMAWIDGLDVHSELFLLLFSHSKAKCSKY